MNKIILNYDADCKFLRTEAISIAIEYEETFMPNKRKGIKNGSVWINKVASDKYEIYVYHTSSSIVVNIRKL